MNKVINIEQAYKAKKLIEQQKSNDAEYQEDLEYKQFRIDELVERLQNITVDDATICLFACVFYAVLANWDVGRAKSRDKGVHTDE